ncbi:2-hydroxychromene-2-carboxylate isomerase [Mesorhizobium sp. 1B3]|uniref:2-hydroxychromene-2-carboxylate isomerase n=1 Tax=Mesorhizobium sp. 1B3 TaxID=3243599 RepID=UPI003D985E50
MTATIDYYFTSTSPWTYLGHEAVGEVARKHGVRLDIRPVDLSGVWAVSGGVPLAKRSPTRQRYRLIELQRYSELRGIPMNLKPKYAPADASLADLATIAILLERGDPFGFLRRVMRAYWAEEQNISDRTVIARLLGAEGFDQAAILDATDSEAAFDMRQRNTEAAITADAIGVPAYVLNGEVFWGQDRIDLLDRALSTGRSPFKPL